MGVDVVMKARLHEPPMGAEEFYELQQAFREKWPADSYYSDKDHSYPDLDFDDYEPVQTIEVVTLWRYYGVGYERGPWPEIKEMGDWLAVKIGERGEVRYGGDSADGWDYLRPWVQCRFEIDPHYEKHGHEPYESPFRRFW